VLLKVVLGGLLVFLGAFMLGLRFHGLENFCARFALPARFGRHAHFGVRKHDSLLLENVLRDRVQLRHLTLRVVDVELRGSMQLEGRHISEL